MPFSILGTPKPHFTDSSGAPLAAGTLSVLEPADDTNKASYPTYDDAEALTNANDNPITLDARGECDLWGIDGEDYKLTLKDSNGDTIWTTDDVFLPNYNNYYGITAAETAASVTPADYSYPPGNVLRYGAAVDDITDDQAAIQRAIDVMAVSGGVVQLAVGTHLIGSSLQMKDGVILRGHGWNSIIKLDDSSVASLTSIQSGTVPAMIYTDDANITDFALENFAVDGNDANNSVTTFWGIGLADCSEFQVRNVKVTDVYGAALGTFLAFDFGIDSCLFKEITGTTGNPGEGMYIRKSYNFTIDHCLGIDLDDHLIYLSGTSAENTSDGAITGCVGVNCGRTSNSSAFNCLDGIRRIDWANCHAYDCKKGFTIVGTNDFVRDVTYTGCSAHSCDDATSPSGFSGSSSSGSDHVRVKFVGCRSYFSGVGTASAVGYGFNFVNFKDLTLDNCEGSGNNYDGVRIDESFRVRVTGNYTNNGQEPTVANRAGVRIEDVDEFHVDIFAIDNDYGAFVTADATNGLISGYLEGNGTGPYIKDGSTAATVKFHQVPETNSDRVPHMSFGVHPGTKTWGAGDMFFNTGGGLGERAIEWVSTAGSPGTRVSVGQIGYRSGSGSPSGVLTPHYIGEEYLDTTGNAWYKSYGTGNTNWQAL